MLYRDCCLTPSSMMACSRQARLVSASAGSHSMVPTVGLALSHTTNDGHSPESARHSRNQSSCDCANIAHAIGGNPSDKRSQAERLSDSHSKDDKNSKKSSFAGLFKRNKSTKTSESSDGQGSPDRESKKTRNKKEKKSKAHKSSDSKDSESSQDSGSSSKKSKKSIWKRKNKEKDKKLESKGSDASLGSAESSPVEAGTGTAVLTPADVGAGTSTLDSLDGLLCGKFLPISSCPHSSCSSPRPDPLCRSYPCSPRVPKPCPARTLPPCIVKPCAKRSKGACGSKSAIPTPCPRRTSPCGIKPCPAKTLFKPCELSLSGSLGGSPRSCSSRNSSLIPCPGSTSSPCAPKPYTRARSSSPCGSPSPCGSKPCPTRSLLKPCSRSQNSSPCRSPSPCGSKLSSEIPCPGSTSSPCDPKPCPVKSLLTPCTRARSSSPCGSPSPCGTKPCPTRSLLKPCSRSQNSSPCRSPSPCGSKLSSEIPCPGSTSTPCDPKPCPAKSLFKPCTRSATPPCGLSGFKLSSLLPCPFNMESSCAQRPPCDYKSPCDQKPSCVPKPPCGSKPCTPKPCAPKPCAPKPCAPNPCISKPCAPKPCAPKPCPAKSRPCSRSQSPCDSPQNSDDNLLNATLSKLSNFLSGPCRTSTPCAPKPYGCISSIKSCSRSQETSPCHSPTLSEDSCLNKTFPCTPKPCPAASAPCTRKPPCIRKTPCAPKPCRPKPCNEISPNHSLLGSANSSCVDICSLTKDPCEPQAPCESTFNPFDFLKRCVQFLPGSEDLKPLCAQEACPRGEAVCPTIKEEINASTSCSRGADKCILTQEESCELAGMCDSARAQYYRNKLISTQQILDNKEETIRIQGESLAVAESRLTTLTIRAGQLRQELECKSRELRMLRRAMSGCCCKETQRVDACTGAEIPPCAELQKHKNVVKTLQTNLSIIEELYRECFYETAKQEALIDKLRQSYLDVRLSEREKSDEIGRLQNVVNTQKWSLDQCQDVAMEVEGLKVEISNFLSSSNNDSGMWERSEESAATDVGEELQQITDQLLQLQHLLHQEDPLIAELTGENCRLKCENNELEGQIGDYRQKVCSLECTIRNNEEVIDNLEREKECTESQLRCAQSQAGELSERVDELECANRCAQDKISDLQCLQNATNQKLEAALEQLCHHECTEAQLRAQLEEAKELAEENQRICGELCALQQSVRAWGAQLQQSQARVCALHAELQRARARADTADLNYREQLEMTAELQEQLEEAHARGAALSEESRRVLCAVRQWVRDNCAQRREQEEKIKRQQSIIWTLNKELEERQCCCAPAPAACGACRAVGCTKCGRARERCGLGTCPAVRVQSDTGVCDAPSCSSGPAPPRRVLKKKTKGCSERCVSRCRSASAQQPEGTRDAATCAEPAPPRRCAAHAVRHLRLAGCIGPSVSPTRPRGQSPSQELLQRVENLHEALAAGQRRWGCAPADRRS